jgi:DNA uptake protein ComE-like DNA-binding protein
VRKQAVKDRTMKAKVIIIAVLAGTIALSAAARAESADTNFAAVMAVCGRCHDASVAASQPRSWERWNGVFYEMTRLGAKGTVEQLQQVTSYFLDNLTILNVNTGTAEELSWVLDVSDEVAQDIIERRQRKPLSSLAELGAVPGMNRQRLQRLKARIEF